MPQLSGSGLTSCVNSSVSIYTREIELDPILYNGVKKNMDSSFSTRVKKEIISFAAKFFSAGAK